jgi:hypothetical protein
MPSFSELAEKIYLEEQQQAQDKQKIKPNWRNGPKWLNVVGISKDDLLNGSSYIEKLKYPPWDKRNNKQANANTDGKIGYGKYADKSYSWVKENDQSYWSWSINNNNRFRQKASELGLN